MSLTFEGNVLPSHVVINSVIFIVEPYIQRVIQCFKCLRYGHVANQCRNTKTLCTKCGEEKKEEHTCNEAFCLNCKNNTHQTTSKTCPQYIEQQQIKKYMAEHNSSFLEAKQNLNRSTSRIVQVKNRYEPLNILSDNEFPSLPTINNNRDISHNKVALSQQIKPTYNFTRSQPTKKRKAQSPTPSSQQIPPMFPFVMGPSQPLPPNPYRPNIESQLENKTQTINLLVQMILEIFSHIKNIDDFKSIDNKYLENKINSILTNLS